ncbi:MAG TPA: hypothetical protein PKD54_03005 [Pirellulaceae bacterium]|nr:hypothetical protein [Pirellulaceae bacterium]
MTTRTEHVVILPYYCQEEVDRYLLMAAWMQENCALPLNCTFLLAASPRFEQSSELLQAYQSLGECRSMQCATQVFGYPGGATAMFWDAMDYIAENFTGEGFALWFESDMAFVKPDWLARLDQEWSGHATTPLVMGCFVPPVYKYRPLRRKKLLLEPHINGGACYAFDFARRMPSVARQGVFDMSIYHYGPAVGRVCKTNQIAFSTLASARRDVLNPQRTVLHGFLQDKDSFVRRCLSPITASELRNSSWNPWIERWEHAKRQVRVLFVRRGQRAMFENMLLAKSRLESK